MTLRSWITGVATLGLVALASPSKSRGQEVTPPQSKPKREPIYDEAADAKALIAEALARAGRDNKRVLVMFGGNWCGWCHKLHDLFKEDKVVGKTLQYEYEVVLVDVGRRDKNLDMAKGYGAALETQGVPFLTVLDAEGKALANQETGSLEAGERHDPDKVLVFLKRWAAPSLDARQVMDAALAKAKSQGKMVFVQLGAPWCGWCRRMDDFLAHKEISAILERGFVDAKVDLDRMTNANEVAARFRSNEASGLPWFAVLDANGKVLANSEASGETVGFPAAPEEIAHFKSMLQKTARQITAEQIDAIAAALERAGKKVTTGSP